jgi:hypothetical protein
MPVTPRTIGPPPEESTVSQMVFLVGMKPKDSNGNGYPDEFAVTVALFTDADRAMHKQGSFEFTLVRAGTIDIPDVAPMQSWTFNPAEAARHEAVSLIGPSYQFALSLAGTGVERVPSMSGDLICVYTPADGGEPVRCNDVRTIQFGRRNARP